MVVAFDENAHKLSNLNSYTSKFTDDKMKILRANKQWLRHRTITYLKENHKELCEPTHMSFFRRFKNFVTASDQWWFIFIFVLTLFLISPLISFDFLNFLELDHKTAIYIVDQRTTNIAAIVSITLVVVGFILNNLAVKSPLVYGLLFKKSLLYPIIYLTLSVIGIFIAISTLRDTLPPFGFTRVVLAGTYFVILILILIGMLFRKVLLFSNEKEIDKMLDEELLIEAKHNLKQILLHKHSEKIFVSIMKDNKAKEYDWSRSLGIINQIVEVDATTLENEKEQKELSVYDVNLDLLSKFIKSRNTLEEVLYVKLSLDRIVRNTDNLVWVPSNANTKKEKSKLLNTFVFKRIPNRQKDNFAMRKFYDNKFDRLSEEDDYRSMEQILESYLRLYELQMQNQQ